MRAEATLKPVAAAQSKRKCGDQSYALKVSLEEARCGGVRKVRLGRLVIDQITGARRRVTEVLHVHIPRGVRDGHTVTVSEMADETSDGCPGDVLFVLAIAGSALHWLATLSVFSKADVLSADGKWHEVTVTGTSTHEGTQQLIVSCGGRRGSVERSLKYVARPGTKANTSKSGTQRKGPPSTVCDQGKGVEPPLIFGLKEVDGEVMPDAFGKGNGGYWRNNKDGLPVKGQRWPPIMGSSYHLAEMEVGWPGYDETDLMDKWRNHAECPWNASHSLDARHLRLDCLTRAREARKVDITRRRRLSDAMQTPGPPAKRNTKDLLRVPLILAAAMGPATKEAERDWSPYVWPDCPVVTTYGHLRGNIVREVSIASTGMYMKCIFHRWRLYLNENSQDKAWSYEAQVSEALTRKSCLRVGDQYMKMLFTLWKQDRRHQRPYELKIARGEIRAVSSQSQYAITCGRGFRPGDGSRPLIPHVLWWRIEPENGDTVTTEPGGSPDSLETNATEETTKCVAPPSVASLVPPNVTAETSCNGAYDTAANCSCQSPIETADPEDHRVACTRTAETQTAEVPADGTPRAETGTVGTQTMCEVESSDANLVEATTVDVAKSALDLLEERWPRELLPPCGVARDIDECNGPHVTSGMPQCCDRIWAQPSMSPEHVVEVTTTSSGKKPRAHCAHDVAAETAEILASTARDDWDDAVCLETIVNGTSDKNATSKPSWVVDNAMLDVGDTVTLPLRKHGHRETCGTQSTLLYGYVMGVTWQLAMVIFVAGLGGLRLMHEPPIAGTVTATLLSHDTVWGTADKIWETVLTSQRPASLATMTTELNDAVVLVTDHMTSRLQVTSELRVGSVAAVLEPAHAWIETAVSSGEPMCNTLIPDTGNDMVAPCCDAESVCPGRSTVMPDEMIKSVQLDVATLRAAVTQVDVELRWLQNAPRRVELAHDETAAACRAQAEAAKELSHRPRTITQPDTRLAETKGSTEPVNVTSAVRRDVGLQTVIGEHCEVFAL